MLKQQPQVPNLTARSSVQGTGQAAGIGYVLDQKLVMGLTASTEEEVVQGNVFDWGPTEREGEYSGRVPA